MARRRTNSGFKFLVVVAVLAVCVGGLYAWLRRGHDQPPTLIGEMSLDNKPALQRIVPPAERFAEQPAAPTNAAPKPPAPAPAAPAPARVEPPAAPSTQPAVSRPAVASDPAHAASDFQEGLAAKERNDVLAARERLNRALHSGLPADQALLARRALSEIAEQTIFGPKLVKGDALTESYTVQAGNSLQRLARRFKVPEDLLAEVNKIKDKHFIREGMTLKIIHGPFHASVVKSEHLLHIYVQDVYVRSYRVALGADGKTPTGTWKVVNHQVNPGWNDPNTGKMWHPDDPKNPIGEFWIGLEGVEGDAVGKFGYGVHGTIEPETIGQDVSLGCVRLAPVDIEAVYKLLVPGESIVTVTD